MDEPRIDLTVFTELQETAGADFLPELVETFAEDAPAQVAALRASRAAQAGDRFRRAAHSLKSNGQTFGARQLAEAARRLEQGGIPADDGPVDALAAELALVVAALRELVRG